MECIKVDNQHIFFLEKEGNKLCYNNINGKLAIAKEIGDLRKQFFELANDTFVDLDEVNYEQLYLAVSESCNFRCKYCRQKKTSNIVNMTIEDIKNAIDTFYSVAKKPKSIVFFGGEPLLNIDGIKFAIEYVRGFDKNIQFSMVINGSLCTKEIASFLAKNQVEVIVSMDGPEEFHNIARININQEGTYKQAIRGYKNLKEAGCKTGISAVIGPHNEKHFDKLIEWAIEQNPNSLGLCLPHGDESNFAMKLSSFDEIHKKMIEAFDILHKNGINLVQVKQKMDAFIKGYSIPYECKACGKRIVACKNKKFGICEGPITKTEMFYDNIDKLPICIHEYKKTSPFYNNSCRNCIAYRVCGGSCVYDKLIRFGRTDIQDECRCGLNKKIAEKSMEYIMKYLPKSNENYILNTEDRKNILSKLNNNL